MTSNGEGAGGPPFVLFKESMQARRVDSAGRSFMPAAASFEVSSKKLSLRGTDDEASPVRLKLLLSILAVPPLPFPLPLPVCMTAANAVVSARPGLVI